MEITPATALCGIVLHPAGHTRSPAMHNAAYAALRLDAAYLAFDVSQFGLVTFASNPVALTLLP